jgi:hypothetical protein
MIAQAKRPPVVSSWRALAAAVLVGIAIPATIHVALKPRAPKGCRCNLMGPWLTRDMLEL